MGTSRSEDRWPSGETAYHSPGELGIIQEVSGFRTVIGDPNAERRQPDNFDPKAGRSWPKRRVR